jgi:hypothetical protein
VLPLGFSAIFGFGFVLMMATMAVPMPTMHENVHQRAQQDQQPWQIRNRKHYVCSMFCPKKIACDKQKPDKN